MVTGAVEKVTKGILGNLSGLSSQNVIIDPEKKQSERIREYKEKNMKRLLTKADIHQVAKFAQNHQTLKQIDEELENEPSVSEEKDESEENERNEQNEEDDADG